MFILSTYCFPVQLVQQLHYVWQLLLVIFGNKLSCCIFCDDFTGFAEKLQQQEVGDKRQTACLHLHWERAAEALLLFKVGALMCLPPGAHRLISPPWLAEWRPLFKKIKKKSLWHNVMLQICFSAITASGRLMLMLLLPGQQRQGVTESDHTGWKHNWTTTLE